MDEQTNELIDIWTDRQADRKVDRPIWTDKDMGRRTDRQIDRRQINERTDGRIDRKINEQMGRRTNRQADRESCITRNRDINR
jgi:hypothetical protein